MPDKIKDAAIIDTADKSEKGLDVKTVLTQEVVFIFDQYLESPNQKKLETVQRYINVSGEAFEELMKSAEGQKLIDAMIVLLQANVNGDQRLYLTTTKLE